MLDEMARQRSEEGVRAGRLIAELRERHHLTQEAAAQLLKVGHRTYQSWEAGTSIPRWPNRVKLGKLYGVDPAQILGPVSPPIDLALVARLAERVSSLEVEVSYQRRVLEAVVAAIETQTSVRVARVARQARRQVRQRPRTGSRRARG